MKGKSSQRGKPSFVLKNEQEWKDLGVEQQGTSQKTMVVLCQKLRFKEDIDGQNVCHPFSSGHIVEVRQ